MKSQRITWTSLPWGHDPAFEGARISAFLSLRLQTDEAARPTLATGFPDITEWATIASGASFRVRVEGSAGEQQVIDTITQVPRPEPELWTTLFPGTSWVRPFVFQDHSTREIQSYSVRGVLAAVQTSYSEIAAHNAEELPLVQPNPKARHKPLAELVKRFGGLLGVANARKRPSVPGNENHHDRTPQRGARELLRETYGPGRVFDSGTAAALDPGSLKKGSPERHLAEAYSFYHRKATRDPYRREPLPGFVAPRVQPREIDVHDMLALLADHPVLLRRLGLVVDLVLSEPIVPATGRLRLEVTYRDEPAAAMTEHVAPWTRFVHSARAFASAPAGDIADGMLKLDGASDVPGASAFDITQIDPDGAALKLLNAASTMKALAVGTQLDYAAYDTPATGSVPTLRAAGLAIVRSQRAAALRARLKATAAHEAADPDAVELDAACLTRGYRIDVQTGGAGPWRSLHRRTTVFTHAGEDQGLDDGYGAPEYSGEGYVKGTSASSTPGGSDLYLHETLARWAGWSLSAERPGRVIYPEPGPGNTQQEHVELRRPNSLDPHWPFDARHGVVPGSLPRLRFGSTYRLRARAVDLAGNALPRTSELADHASAPVRYLRWEPVAAPDLVALAPFTEGASLEHLVMRSDAGVAAVDYHETERMEGFDLRHILPPKTAVDMAEAHGAFDTIADDREAYAVARREQGVLRGGPQFEKVLGAPGPARPDGAADEDPPGTYWIHPTAPLVLPYLPDVLSAGMTVREVGGKTLMRTDWGAAAWPAARPTLFEIVELSDGMERVVFNAATRRLTIALAQAEVLRIRISSTLDKHALDLLGVLGWALEAADNDAQRTALRLLALEGGHWMLTPRRELTLVHAVQRPLWAPKVVPLPPAEPGDKPSAAPDGFDARRSEIGQTHAVLSADVDLSVRSTGQIDMDAAWTEFVDDLEHPRPATLPTAGRVSTLRVPAWMPDGVNALPFHETPKPKDPIAARTWIAAPVHHEFGDTKHREVTYTLTAGTRFREYFPPAITDDPAKITQSGAGCVAHVPSSARPAAPLPRYAIPTFGWTRTGVQPGWTSARSVRSGGGVRVWMDRPWYSSGAQERFGIVLHPGSEAVSDQLRPLVSQYGRDPIWDTEKPAHFLRVGDFAGHIAEEAVSRLTLDERADSVGVGVVSYEAAFDEQRRLWYADVRLPGKAVASYTPFVRLATARLQPWSLPDVELSRVALLDFLQLVPTRTLELRRSGERVQLSLTGVAPDGPLTNEVHVTVEIHDGKIPGDMGWRAVAGHEAVELHEGVLDPARFLGEARVDNALHTPELLRRLAFRAAPAVAGTASAGDADVHAMISAEEVTRLLPEFDDRFGEAIIKPIPLIVLPGHRRWSGAIGLPAVRGAQRLRLVVREVEVLRSDREAVGSSDPEKGSPPARRIVYLETIEL